MRFSSTWGSGLYLLLLCSSGLAVSIQDRNDARIIGGAPTIKGEVPWIILITHAESGMICAGALLSSEWLITSASCADAKHTLYEVTAGEFNLTQEEGTEQRRTIERVVMHPDFVILDETCDSTDNIALMKVSPPFVINAFVQPIALVSSDFVIFENSTVEITGWGIRSEAEFDPAEIIHKLLLPTITDADCKQAYDSHDCLDGTITFEETDFCARIVNGNGPCANDGGDPAVCRHDHGQPSLCGIVNDIYCGDATKPQRFSEISHSIDWILQSVEPEQLDNTTWTSLDGTCGGVIVGSSGRVTFNSSFNRNYTCTWTIRANAQSKVLLSLEEFNIPEGDSVFVTTIDAWTGLVEQNYKFTRSEIEGPILEVLGPLILLTYVAADNADTSPNSGFIMNYQGTGFSYSVRRRFAHLTLDSLNDSLRYPALSESGEMVPYKNSETATFTLGFSLPDFTSTRANITLISTAMEEWNGECNGDGITVNKFRPLDGFTFYEQICGYIGQPISYLLDRGVGESIAFVFQTDDEGIDYGFNIRWDLE